MTGDPKRTPILGKRNGNEIKYPWNKYTFPACGVCNNEYAELEGKTQKIVEKILQKSSLSENEVITFLDWLDKVRIGIWLGNYLMNNEDRFQPNFHITDRVGLSDRMVAINYYNNQEIMLGFGGTETRSFYFNPSCFNLSINNVQILNISTAFMFGGRLGLPFPKKAYVVDDNSKILVEEFDHGRERIFSPLLRKPFYPKSIRLFQASYKESGFENENVSE